MIEPPELDGLFAAPRNFVIAVAVFEWLIFELSVKLGTRLEGVEIETIGVEYQGAYPALGLRYGDACADDLGEVVKDAISQILRDEPAMSFVRFVTRSATDWGAVSEKIVHG